MAVKKFSTDSSIKNSFKLSRGATSVAKPEAPTIGAVAAGATPSTQVTVAYTAATLGAAASTFTATSTPSSLTGTGSSPITVSGLTASTSYTFTVKASNANGDSPASAASSSITTSALPTAYESIATVTVSSATPTITFSSIPATFTHLQIRAIIRSTTTGADAWVNVYLNSDTTTSNYINHNLFGNGTSASAGVNSGSDGNLISRAMGSASGASDVFAPNIFDILDYANTNKFTTTRTLIGQDNNGSRNLVGLVSNLWRNTAAVTNIQFTTANNFAQYTQFALYGIKGA